VSYYENDWEMIRDTACDGFKLMGAATVLWVYAIYLILHTILSRIYAKLTDD